MNCQPQDCNDNVKQVFSTSPVFEVPTFEVVTSGILDFGGQMYEEVDYFSCLCAICPPVNN